MPDRATRRPSVPAWDRREPAGLFSLEETARRVGNYRWVELRLFEGMGAWVRAVPEPDVKLKLGTHCYHHSWHAELWHDRIPELREMDPDRLTAPANLDVVALLDTVFAPEPSETTIEKLVGVYRVLIPRKIAAYTHHRNNASLLMDGPTVRSLDLVLADEVEDWREGELLLQSLIRTEEQARRAARHQGRLETIATRAGGIAGPESVGDQVGDQVEGDASHRWP